MFFSSLTFLYFLLPLNLILYYISKNSVYRNTILILFSFIFYAWGQPAIIVLLLFASFVAFICGRLISLFEGKPYSKFVFISSIIANLLPLIFFKYNGFIIETLNRFFQDQAKVPVYALPVGISFFTFRAVSYIIDVRKKEVKAENSIWNFLMFMSLFHLVSGPIVRYTELQRDIANRKSNLINISSGVSRFCIGLFKKVYIANIAGTFVAKYLDADLSLVSVSECWFGIILFAVQIYFDFSGYSDMAIGLGKMFGFKYIENFNYPYISKSVTEFWKRWHISLSNWLRDYIFIPFSIFLSLNFSKNNYLLLRKEKMIYMLASLLTFFICGLWHGSTLNFILWGLYFGFFICLERLFLLHFFKKIHIIFSRIYFTAIIIFSWIIFYFADLSRMREFISIIFFRTKNPLWNFELGFILKENIFWIVFALMLCTPVYLYADKWFRRFIANKKRYYMLPVSLIISLILLILSTSLLVGSSYHAFIYAKF